MPKYRVQLSDGRIVTVDAAQPPTEDQILGQLGPRPQAQSHAAPEDVGSLVDTAITALPTIGGAVGSFAGGGRWNPLGMAGAALGGTAGEAFKQTANAMRGRMDLVPRSASEQLQSMMTAGAVQGGLEGVGRGVGKSLKALAPKLADVALNPIESLARKYPDIAQTYVTEGKLFPGLRGGIGAVGKKSSVAHAAGLRTASRQSSDKMLRAADAARAAPIRAKTALAELKPIMRDAATDVRAGKADLRPALTERARAFTTRSPQLSLSEANVIRRRLDDTAEKAFEAARKGQAINVTEASADKAIAGGLRHRIRQGAEAAGQKDYTATTGRTRDLAGLTKALDKASTRKHLLTRNLGLTSGAIGLGTGLMSGDPLVGSGAALGSLGTYYALTNPRNLGRIALASHGAGTAAEITPQLIRAAILAQLAQEQKGPR